MQLTLFDDDAALARKSDPVTSHAAATEIRPSIGKLQASGISMAGGVRRDRARQVSARHG